MAPKLEEEENQSAYQRLRAEIAEKYPLDRFIAIGGGKVIADTETFEEMLVRLAQNGWNPRDVMVVQAGDTTPEFVNII